MPALRVAMLAPPWLRMPPTGYGGLEYVVHFLAVELANMGIEVELFATGNTDTPSTRLHSYFDEGQYRHIAQSLYDVVALPITHLLFALEQVKRDGGFDLIHDHNGFLGPAMAGYLDPGAFPPVLHTLHGPFTGDALVARGVADNRHVYTRFALCDRLWFNGISYAQLTDAPGAFMSRVVDVVHNALNTDDYPYVKRKHDYFITLARFARDKGQAVAARLAREQGAPLRMAGIINGIATPDELTRQLANPNSRHRDNPDFAYYRDDVLPFLAPGVIEFVGNMAGQAKIDFIGNARALLFPIDWEEPFGLAVIEALACGTPVVAMRRGAMGEIVEHGVNGFLADNERDFASYMQRVDEIDPADCRRTVLERFSAPVMARNYLRCYERIVASSGTRRRTLFMGRRRHEPSGDQVSGEATSHPAPVVGAARPAPAGHASQHRRW